MRWVGGNGTGGRVASWLLGGVRLCLPVTFALVKARLNDVYARVLNTDIKNSCILHRILLEELRTHADPDEPQTIRRRIFNGIWWLAESVPVTNTHL